MEPFASAWSPYSLAHGAAWVGVAGATALVVDRCFGEPPARCHPVVWMGNALDAMAVHVLPAATPGRPDSAPDAGAFLRGALAWSLLALLVAATAHAAQALLLQLPAAAAAIGLGLLLKPMLSWRMLCTEVLAVETALGRSLEEGRQHLRRLASRDVAQLSDDEVRETAIESLAENLNDSVVAPVFWFLLLGLPGAALYRFANTADAMWGYRGVYKGRNWEWAGKWAARADDVLSWLPARITACLLALVGGGLSPRALLREAGLTPSPNSGWPMAAMALVLDVRLRKPGVYALNAEGRAPLLADTGQAVRLADRAVLLLSVLAVFCLAGGFAA